MIRVAIDVSEAKSLLADAAAGRERMQAVVEWTRQWVRRGLEALLRIELTVLLEREQGSSELPNWRNGYRSRTLSVAGLGPLGLRVPRDRQGHYRSELLPFRKRRTMELEELAAEMFLGGLSTRDVCRVLERHFGERFDSKEISRMVSV